VPTYNREGSKLRAAAKAVVSAAVATLTFSGHAAPTTVNHYNALRARNKRAASVTTNQEKVLPCVSYQTLDGEEVVKTLGTKRVPLILLIESSADSDDELANDDPEANHDDLVSAVFDAINDDATPASLSSALSDFHVLDVIDMGELDVEAEDGRFKTAHRWDVVCANTDL